MGWPAAGRGAVSDLGRAALRVRGPTAAAVRGVREVAERVREGTVPRVRAGGVPLRKKQKVKVRLADGKERAIRHIMLTTLWHPDGTPLSAQQFRELLFGKLTDFFQSQAELRALGRAPDTRAKWLQGLAEKDFGHDKLVAMQPLIDAEQSDLFDVLADVACALPIVTRGVRADPARVHINSTFNAKPQAFLDFVLQHYAPKAWKNWGRIN